MVKQVVIKLLRLPNPGPDAFVGGPTESMIKELASAPASEFYSFGLRMPYVWNDFISSVRANEKYNGVDTFFLYGATNRGFDTTHIDANNLLSALVEQEQREQDQVASSSSSPYVECGTCLFVCYDSTEEPLKEDKMRGSKMKMQTGFGGQTGGHCGVKRDITRVQSGISQAEVTPNANKTGELFETAVGNGVGLHGCGHHSHSLDHEHEHDNNMWNNDASTNHVSYPQIARGEHHRGRGRGHHGGRGRGHHRGRGRGRGGHHPHHPHHPPHPPHHEHHHPPHHGHHEGHHHHMPVHGTAHFHEGPAEGPQHGNGRDRKRPKRQARAMVRFVKHISFEDNTVVLPQFQFQKVWKVRNDSNMPWPKDSELINVGGEPMSALPLQSGVQVGPLQPGMEKDIAVDLIAPKHPGKYQSFWRLREGKEGRKFGQRLWVQIIVHGANDDDDSSSTCSSSSSSSSSSVSSGDERGSSRKSLRKLEKKHGKQAKKMLKKKYKRKKKQRKLEKKAAKLRRKLNRIERKLGKMTQVDQPAKLPIAQEVVESAHEKLNVLKLSMDSKSVDAMPIDAEAEREGGNNEISAVQGQSDLSKNETATPTAKPFVFVERATDETAVENTMTDTASNANGSSVPAVSGLGDSAFRALANMGFSVPDINKALEKHNGEFMPSLEELTQSHKQ